MIDENDVDYVAKLANIEIGPKEKKQLKFQLAKIIDYIDQLKELNTEKIKPLRTVQDQVNRFRQDKAKKSLCQEQILNNAPNRQGNYFKIPKVID